MSSRIHRLRRHPTNVKRIPVDRLGGGQVAHNSLTLGVQFKANVDDRDIEFRMATQR